MNLIMFANQFIVRCVYMRVCVHNNVNNILDKSKSKSFIYWEYFNIFVHSNINVWIFLIIKNALLFERVYLHYYINH